MILINVLMPVYNSVKYLSESIESILNQTYTNFNFLILDDGSNDGSLDIIRNYASQDKRVIILQNRINLGRPCSRNILISEQKKYSSEYCAWLDSDDIAVPIRLEKQFSYMQQHPDTDIIGSAIKHFGNNNHTYIPYINNKDICSLIFIANPIMNSTAFFKTKLTHQNLIKYDEKFLAVQDFDLWTRLCGKVKFTNLSETLVMYRRHNRQITNKIETIRFYHIKSVKKWYEQLGIKVSNRFLYEIIFDKKLTSKETIQQRTYFIRKILGIKNFYGYKQISYTVLLSLIKRCYGEGYSKLQVYRNLISDLGFFYTFKNTYKFIIIYLIKRCHVYKEK